LLRLRGAMTYLGLRMPGWFVCALALSPLVLVLGISACGPRPTRVVTAPNGDPAFLVECYEASSCASRATEVCPAGYDVLGAGEAIDRTQNLLCPTADPSCRQHRDRSQMLVQCKASPTLPGLPTYAAAPPPRAAGGFVLGAKVAELQAACEHAGYAFGPFGSPEQHWLRCSGFLENPGFRGFALLRPCADRVCTVRLVVGAEQNQSWLARTTNIALALSSQFGTPHQGAASGFVACAADPDACMRAPHGRIEFLWRWPDGHRVSLVTRANHPHPPLALVTYRVAPGSTPPAASPDETTSTTGDEGQSAPHAEDGLEEPQDAGAHR
jgi:hypothetical protein